jgi:hypothetical protein
MTKLLSVLDAPGNGPTAYQVYTLQHGIERLEIRVPIKNTQAFEQQFAHIKDKKKTTILSLVESVGGKIKG